MKTSEIFLQAKKDKNLRSFLLFDENSTGKRMKYIRLAIDVKNKYSNNYESPIFIECDTDIKYEDYSGKQLIKNNDNYKTCFHCSIYSNESHIKTFLKAINKNTDVKFKVIAYNGCEAWEKLNLVHHSLYGIINDKDVYLLEQYTGHNNTASPIQL